jgi:hypothetical protein
MSKCSCKAILDIYTSRTFQRYKEHPNARCFDPYNQALHFWESRRTRTSHFWECEFHLHTYPKVGLWLVSSHSRTPLVLGQATCNLDSLDSPRPGLGGSHHLPPYSILCSSPRRLHLNGTFSRDSQGGVPKLSRFGLPGLWELITPGSDLRLG